MNEDLSVSLLNTSLSFNFNVEIDNEGQNTSKMPSHLLLFMPIQFKFMFYDVLNIVALKMLTLPKLVDKNSIHTFWQLPENSPQLSNKKRSRA